MNHILATLSLNNYVRVANIDVTYLTKLYKNCDTSVLIGHFDILSNVEIILSKNFNS